MIPVIYLMCRTLTDCCKSQAVEGDHEYLPKGKRREEMRPMILPKPSRVSLEPVRGEALEENGRVAKCPVHRCMGKETDWLPPVGISPFLREFRCNRGRHAFYVEYID